MRPPLVISDEEFQARVTRLIASGGDNVLAGVGLEEVADMIYTRRIRINPEVGEQVTIKPKGARKKTTGEALDNLLPQPQQQDLIG